LFGYIKIYKPELRIKEYEMYKDWALKLVDIYEQLGIDFDV